MNRQRSALQAADGFGGAPGSPTRAAATRTALPGPAGGVSYGRADGRAVFMDLDADLYFMSAPEDEAELIASAGAPASPPEARSSLFDRAEPPAIALRDCLPVLIRLVRVRFALRHRQIAAIVSRARALPGFDPGGSEDAASLASRFWAVRKLLPVPHHCLADSLALIAWLARRGIRSTLVFGVKLDPFAAHCWVQSGTLLLTDGKEAVERFTPVRTVECGPATH